MAKSVTPKVLLSLTAAPLPVRCFSFALAPACHQLLRGLSVLSRGQAYFLRPGERLQPKVSVSLCSAFLLLEVFLQNYTQKQSLVRSCELGTLTGLLSSQSLSPRNQLGVLLVLVGGREAVEGPRNRDIASGQPLSLTVMT